MKNCQIKLLALGAVALAGLSLSVAPVRAQDVSATDSAKPISLNLINVPIQTALRTLFSSAGIRAYSIDGAVQGNANINVSDVPFSVALRQLLNSGNPPLSFSLVDGVYQIKVAQAPPPPVVSVITPDQSKDPAVTDANAPKRFYVIPIDSYDAFYIATLVGQTGIVEVVPNYPAGQSGGQGGAGGQNGNRGGQGGIGGGTSGVTTIGGGVGGGGGYGSFGGNGGGGGGGGFGSGGGYGGGMGGGGFGGGFRKR